MKKLKKIGLIILGTLLIIGVYLFYNYPYLVTEKTPFTDIVFENEKTLVEINNKKYEWISSEGESIEEIQSFAKKKYADKWQHRMSDDYILLMKDMGHWAYFSTKLKLKDNKGNYIEKSFLLLEENRITTRKNKEKNRRINRKHITQIPDSLKYITHRVDGYKPKENVKKSIQDAFEYNSQLPMDGWIPKELAIADLENLEYQLKNTYSYADLKGVNYTLVIDAIIADIQDGISKRDLGIQIKRLMALFGDGHSRVSRSKLEIDSLFLPFQIKKIDNKYIAISKDELFNNKYPELISIDGYSISFLQKKAGEMIAKASPQFYENGSLTYLSYYGFIQKQLNIKNSVPKIQLANEKDTISIEIQLVGVEELSKLYTYKDSHHKLLPGNIGYVYLHSMEKKDDYQDWLKKVMAEFKDTKGLIIDIRGNGGGNRKPIYTLLPYFLTSPKVINVNALRINKELDPDIDEPIGGLEDRMSYPENSKHWTIEERQAISDFKNKFKPEWELDKNKFSKWHYSVISPNNSYYSKPVIILMDSRNFSASDIFLGAFKGTKNVTLIGQKTGGGSGFARVNFLPNSGLMYLLSRMASFQPNGKLYDGNGITPDIEIEETLENIGKDVELDKAIEVIMLPNNIL